jgi:hypothetical protein
MDLIVFRLTLDGYVPVLCVSRCPGAAEAEAEARKKYPTSKLKVKVASECTRAEVAAARAAK